MQDKRLIIQLTQYWQLVVDELVKSLNEGIKRNSKDGTLASGNTAQSIADGNKKLVTITSNGFRIQIAMPDYYQYIDEGVSGAKNNTGISRFKYTSKMPPISAIRKFMLNRGIDPAKESNTTSGKRRDDEAIRNGLAYVIARSIFENGVKPTNFYSNVINDKKLLDFESKLLEQYRKYIINIIKVE